MTVNESFPYYGRDLSGRLHSATLEYFRLIEDNRYIRVADKTVRQRALLKCSKMLPYTSLLVSSKLLVCDKMLIISPWRNCVEVINISFKFENYTDRLGILSVNGTENNFMTMNYFLSFE